MCPELSSTAGVCTRLCVTQRSQLLLLTAASAVRFPPLVSNARSSAETITPPFQRALGRHRRGEYSEAMQQVQEYATLKPHFAKLPLKMGEIQEPQQARGDFRTSKPQYHRNTPSASLKMEMGTHANRALDLRFQWHRSLGMNLHRGWPFTSQLARRL